MIDVARYMEEESLKEVFENMPAEQRAKVVAVAIDIWSPLTYEPAQVDRGAEGVVRGEVVFAWTIKKMFSKPWGNVYGVAARDFFKKWYWMGYTIAVSNPWWRWQDEQEASGGHPDLYQTRITNAVAEALNSRILQIKSAARGFRNFENYRTAIMSFCEELDMYPQKSQ